MNRRRAPRYDLIAARLAIGLTQSQLAALVGVSRAAVAQWETGYTKFPAYREEQVFGILGAGFRAEATR